MPGRDQPHANRRHVRLAVGLVVVAVVLLFTPLAWLDIFVVLLVLLAVLSEGVGGRGMLGFRRHREVYLRQRGAPPPPEISAPAPYDEDAWERERRRRLGEAEQSTRRS